MPNPKPLLSFAIPVFNMEDYIQEAVESAFAQTYSPLEIIISDDHSNDRTFQIIMDLATAYHGSHQIILNRNSFNLGLAGQWNQIIKLARGEFIISAGGDDISLPNRTEMIWKEWESSFREVFVIQSSSIDIDENGIAVDKSVDRTVPNCHDPEWKNDHSVLNYLRTLSPQVVGCAFAFSPLVFSTFGPLPRKLIHEDNVITLRGLSLGRIIYIETPLVKRRFHSRNSYSRYLIKAETKDKIIEQEERVSRDAQNRKDMYQVFLNDMHKAITLRLINENLWLDIERECQRHLRLLDHLMKFIKASIGMKVWILISSIWNKTDISSIKWMLPRFLPFDWFTRIKTFKNTTLLAYKW